MSKLKPQRYDLEWAGYGFGQSSKEMQKCSDGDWVEWEDYEALEKENQRLKEQCSKCPVNPVRFWDEEPTEPREDTDE